MAHPSSLPLQLPLWAGVSGAGRLLQAQVHDQSDMHCQRQHQWGCGCVPLFVSGTNHAGRASHGAPKATVVQIWHLRPGDVSTKNSSGQMNWHPRSGCDSQTVSVASAGYRLHRRGHQSASHAWQVRIQSDSEWLSRQTDGRVSAWVRRELEVSVPRPDCRRRRFRVHVIPQSSFDRADAGSRRAR